jgi:hypothetical protein
LEGISLKLRASDAFYFLVGLAAICAVAAVSFGMMFLVIRVVVWLFVAIILE